MVGAFADGACPFFGLAFRAIDPMAGKHIHYYLIKIARISGWLLLPLMILYIGTGFAVRGELGFDNLLTPEEAKVVHQDFRWAVVALFFVHASTTVYFALRRWGWIKNKKKIRN